MAPGEDNASSEDDATAAAFGNSSEAESLKNMKVPAFWRTNVKLWFMKVEAQFHGNNIRSDLSKYYAVVSALDCSTL